MIIGISGKAQSGKDTVGKIIQYLQYCSNNGRMSYSTWSSLDSNYPSSYWKVHKFADALKDIVCILTGCTREQLEDIAFKDSFLDKEWDAFEDVEPPSRLTYRQMLQYLGTDLLRNQLHENVWVNALMSKYKGTTYTDISKDCPNQGVFDVTEADELQYSTIKTKYPNWIITDVRFPNEANAIKAKDGFIIRIENPNCAKLAHESETALDNYQFDEVIHNDSDIATLITKVEFVLKRRAII